MNTKTCWTSVAALLLMLPLLGCNDADTISSQSTRADTGDVAVLATQPGEDGCCGKCALEQDSEECCGKCKSATNSGAPCCSGNEDQPQNTSDSAESCSEDCNACADGDSSGCKCNQEKDASSIVQERHQKGRGRQGKGQGPQGKGKGKGRQGKGQVNPIAHDRDVFHYLLENHSKITRKVEELENGVRTVTESDDPAVVSKLQNHVESMYQRVEHGQPVRRWDELYREIFDHAEKIEMKIKRTDRGIAVTETSQDPYVVKLIKAHAKVVSKFAKRGFEEARQNHPAPEKQ